MVLLPRETPLARPTDRWANDVECFMQMAKRGSSCPVRGPSNRPATRLRYGVTIFARGMTIQPHEEHCVQTKQKPRIIPNPCFPFYVCQDVHCRRPCTAPPPRCSLLTRPAFVSPPLPPLSLAHRAVFSFCCFGQKAPGEKHIGTGGMADTRDPAPVSHEDPRKSISAAPTFAEYLKSKKN